MVKKLLFWGWLGVAGCGMSEQEVQWYWDMDKYQNQQLKESTYHADIKIQDLYEVLRFYYWQEYAQIRERLDKTWEQLTAADDLSTLSHHFFLGGQYSDAIDTLLARGQTPSHFADPDIPETVFLKHPELEQRLETRLSRLFDFCHDTVPSFMREAAQTLPASERTSFEDSLLQYQTQLRDIVPREWQKNEEIGWLRQSFEGIPAIKAIWKTSRWKCLIAEVRHHIIGLLAQYFHYGERCPIWYYSGFYPAKETLYAGDDLEGELYVGNYRESLCSKDAEITITIGKDTIHADEDGLAHYTVKSPRPGKKLLTFYFYEYNKRTGRVHDWGRNLFQYEVVNCPEE